MKKITTLLFALCGGAVLAAECTLTGANIAPGSDEYTFCNGIFSIKCIPDASGVISGIYSIPEKRQLMDPVQYRVIVDDLLPRRSGMAPNGTRELARRVKVENFTNYRVKNAVADSKGAMLELYSRAFYSRDIATTKKITLPAGASKITVALEMRAHSTVENFSFWINSIAHMDEGLDTALMPLQKNVAKRCNSGLYVFDKDGICVDNVRNLAVNCAPLKPWMARVSSRGRSGVMAVVVRGKDAAELINGGFIFGWKHSIRDLHTNEIIMPAKNMKKGEVWNFEYEMLYFAGLKSLRSIAGDFGIDRQGDTLLIASAATSVPGTVKLKWATGSAGVKIPGLIPGEVFKIDLKKVMPDTSAELTGIMPGNIAFDLPELISPRK